LRVNYRIVELDCWCGRHLICTYAACDPDPSFTCAQCSRVYRVISSFTAEWPTFELVSR
jgi:hypothetical protein